MNECAWYQVLAFIAFGVMIGWVTKIPWFLKHYRHWERTMENMREWMKTQEK